MLGLGGIGGADEEGAFGYKFGRSGINKGGCCSWGGHASPC